MKTISMSYEEYTNEISAARDKGFNEGARRIIRAIEEKNNGDHNEASLIIAEDFEGEYSRICKTLGINT